MMLYRCLPIAICLFLLGCGGVPSDSKTIAGNIDAGNGNGTNVVDTPPLAADVKFSPQDLEGSWHLSGGQMGVDALYKTGLLEGVITFDKSGVVLGGYLDVESQGYFSIIKYIFTDNKKPNLNENGLLSTYVGNIDTPISMQHTYRGVNAAGDSVEMIDKINLSILSGKMNRNKNIIMIVASASDGQRFIISALKESGGFPLDVIMGSWMNYGDNFVHADAVLSDKSIDIRRGTFKSNSIESNYSQSFTSAVFGLTANTAPLSETNTPSYPINLFNNISGFFGHSNLNIVLTNAEYKGSLDNTVKIYNGKIAMDRNFTHYSISFGDLLPVIPPVTPVTPVDPANPNPPATPDPVYKKHEKGDGVPPQNSLAIMWGVKGGGTFDVDMDLLNRQAETTWHYYGFSTASVFDGAIHGTIKLTKASNKGEYLVTGGTYNNTSYYKQNNIKSGLFTLDAQGIVNMSYKTNELGINFKNSDDCKLDITKQIIVCNVANETQGFETLVFVKE